MKLLGWLQRKSKHGSNDSSKTFSTDDSSCFPYTTFDKQAQDAESMFCFACLGQPKVNLKSFGTGIQPKYVEDIDKEELVNELFQGFLAIGTLGGEPLNTEPATPTFPNISETTTNEEWKITDNELMFISHKLEKYLEADGEAEEAASKTSSRSSQASVITLSNNPSEEANAEDNANKVTCPLQKYLFGSKIELPKMEVSIKKEKPSVGEGYKGNSGHKILEGMQEYQEKQAKQNHGSHFLKKMMKKLRLASTTSATSLQDAGQRDYIKMKLAKVLKVFHKRVHPEGLVVEKKIDRSCIKTFEKIFCKSGGYPSGEHREDTTEAQRANPGKETNFLELSIKTISSVPSTATKEHWIKTDADYLVLEL